MALLEVKDLVVRFPLKRPNILAPREYLYAVNGVSFDLERGKTLAIVGESGSGKTTTALTIARLVAAHSGSVTLDGQDMLSVEGAALRAARTKFQFIFQDPYSSLNPRLRAGDIVAEPLRSLGQTPQHEIQPRVDELFVPVIWRTQSLEHASRTYSRGRHDK